MNNKVDTIGTIIFSALILIFLLDVVGGRILMLFVFAFLFLIFFALPYYIVKNIVSRPNSLDRESISVLKILIYFIKITKNYDAETQKIITKMFKGYKENDVKNAVKNNLYKKIDIENECRIVKEHRSKLAFLTVYHLFEIASINNFFTINELQIIFEISKKLNFNSVAFNNIKQVFIKKGVQEETYKYRKNEKSYQKNKSFSNEAEELKIAYKILDLSVDANFETIKKRYRKLVKETHPDKFYRATKEQIKISEQKFREIKEAYELIKKYKK